MKPLPTVGGDTGSWGTILNAYLQELVPPGSMVAYAGSTAPAGWLIADGNSYLRADYNDLFTALGGTGSPWGLPDGTHFNVPDMRGRTPVGLGTNASVNALAATEGVATVGNRRPHHRHSPHTHLLNMDNSTYSSGNADSAAFGQPPASHPNDSTAIVVGADGGSGNANDSLDAPAFAVVNYIIKT